MTNRVHTAETRTRSLGTAWPLVLAGCLALGLVFEPGAASAQNCVSGTNTFCGPGAGTGTTGNSNAAVGSNAGQNVEGNSNIAIGNSAGQSVTFDDTISIGTNALAAFASSTALGANAATTVENEMMFGTTDSLYTTPGVTSAASAAAQTGVLSFVTTDQDGHLAANLVVPADVTFCSEPGAGAFQCGTGAVASGIDATAVGQNAQATATGAAAYGNGANAGNTNATATGTGANASGASSAAYGTGSLAEGESSTAIGHGAYAAGFGDTAVGHNAQVFADESNAFGTNATVQTGHTNSTALGTGAATTRANQVMMGTGSTTYTTPGITSGASKSAQGSPTHLVTSNDSGDLAAYTFAQLGLASSGDVAGLQSQINRLGRRDDELTEGLAAVVALAQPILRSGQTFGVSAGWGGFDDASAIGLSAAGVLADNLLRPGSGTLALYGGMGIGTGEGQVAGRAGQSFGW